MAVGPDGYEGWEHGCKTIKSTVRKEDDYVMRFRCEGEGFTWFEDSEWRLTSTGDLIVDSRRQWGNKEET